MRNVFSFIRMLITWISILSCLQSAENLKLYYATCFSLIAGIIIFGGLLAPIVSYSISAQHPPSKRLTLTTKLGSWNYDACSFISLNIYPFVFQLEIKLGLGGTSYADFIRSVHLPMQLRYGTCIGSL